MRTCEVIEDGVKCERKQHAKGMCGKHYQIHRRSTSTEICGVIENGEQCEGRQEARGMCPKHYARWKSNGDPLVVRCVRERRDHEKWCPPCKSWLPKSEFTKSSKSKDGLASWCRSCNRNYLYGVSKDRFNQMLADQGGTCAVCDATEPGGSGDWHVDHDHSCCPESGKSCGKCVRGLLCSGCNTGLGLFDDDPDRLLAAAMYLLKHTTNTEVTQ